MKISNIINLFGDVTRGGDAFSYVTKAKIYLIKLLNFK